MKHNSLLKRSWNPASLQLFDNSYYLKFDILLLMIHAIWVSNIKYADVNEQTGGINNNESFQLSNGIGDVRVYEYNLYPQFDFAGIKGNLHTQNEFRHRKWTITLSILLSWQRNIIFNLLSESEMKSNTKFLPNLFTQSN